MCSAATAAFAIDATIRVKPSEPRIVFRIIFSFDLLVMLQAQVT
jgi:hypothetical protein